MSGSSASAEEIIEILEQILWEAQLEELYRQIERVSETREEKAVRGKGEFDLLTGEYP